MADCGDWQILVHEVSDHCKHLLIHPQVLWRSAAWNEQSSIALKINIVKIIVYCEVVTYFLIICLLSICKIMHSHLNFVANLLSRTHCMHLKPKHRQSLERNVHFKLLSVISDQHQYLLICCFHCLFYKL
jgi:hypothetical protein